MIPTDFGLTRPATDFVLSLLGTGCRVMEIGVQEGTHAAVMKQALKPSLFRGVDPWTDQVRGDEVYHEDNLNRAKHRLAADEIVHERSQVALPRMSDDSFDFIYIDGDHRHEACAADIRNGLRLVRVGGVLGGHDYGLPPMIMDNSVEGYESVPRAVQMVLSGLWINSYDGDWWIVVTEEIKKRGARVIRGDLSVANIMAMCHNWQDRIFQLQPRNVVELGTGQGASGACIMEMLPPGSTFTTINYADGHKFGEQLGPWSSDPRLHMLAADTILPATLELVPDNIDLLFIDTTHEAWHAAQELRLWQDKLQDGAIVIVDDLNQHDMNLFWDSLPYEKVPSEAGTCQGVFRYSAALRYNGSFDKREGSTYGGDRIK